MKKSNILVQKASRTPYKERSIRLPGKYRRRSDKLLVIPLQRRRAKPERPLVRPDRRQEGLSRRQTENWRAKIC